MPGKSLLSNNKKINTTFDDHIKKGIKKDTNEDRLIYFRDALANLINYLLKYNINNKNNKIDTIVFPNRIGCGLAGGNWSQYESEIKKFAIKLHTAADDEIKTLIVRKINWIYIKNILKNLEEKEKLLKLNIIKLKNLCE